MNQKWQQSVNTSGMEMVPRATCVLAHSEYLVVMFSLALAEFTKEKAEGGVNVCDRSSWLFTRSFLPPFPPFSPLPFSFPGPLNLKSAASPAAGPGPHGLHCFWSSWLWPGDWACWTGSAAICPEGVIDGCVPHSFGPCAVHVVSRCLHHQTMENQGQAFSTLAALPRGYTVNGYLLQLPNIPQTTTGEKKCLTHLSHKKNKLMARIKTV